MGETMMKNPSGPQRIIAIASPNNAALTASLIHNATKNQEHYDIRNCIILHDKSVTNINSILSLLQPLSMDIQTELIPEINDLFTSKLSFEFQESDCILVPSGTQLHFGLIISKLSKAILEGSINTGYMCFSHPSGDFQQWYALQKKNQDLRITSERILTQGIDKLDWVFENRSISYDRLYFPISKSDLQYFVDFECSDEPSDHKIDLLISLARPHTNQKKPGILFERFVAKILENSPRVHEVAINLELEAEWKSKHFEKIVYKEDDIFCLTRNGKIIYISCKFSLKMNRQKTRNLIKNEIQEMLNLKLPVKFPEERIERLIVTSTKAYNETLDLAGGVQITNLENLSEIVDEW